MSEPEGHIGDPHCTSSEQSNTNTIDPIENAFSSPSDDPSDKNDDPIATLQPPAPLSPQDRRVMRKDILSLAWPSVIELVLTSLAGMVDMIMVGRLGTYAITAVGLTNQPKFLILSSFIALNVGSTAMIARFKGMDDQKSANAVLRQSLIMTFVISIVLSVVGYVYSRQMLIFMGAGPDTIQAGTEYLQIQMLGLITNSLALAITAALRGAGNTRASMVLNTTSNVVNVLFNFLLIYGLWGFPRLGVAGASIATVLGQLVGCIIAFGFVLRGNQYVSIARKQSWKPDFTLMKRMMHVGVPAMLEQLVMRVGLLSFTRIVAGLGTVMYATHQIAMSLLSLSFMNGQAFGIAATTLVGQSLGRGEPDDAWHYTRETRRMSTIVSIGIALVMFFFGKYMMMLYSDDPEVIGAGVIILQIIAFVQPSQGSFQVLAGGLRGAGDTRVMAVIMGICIMVIRPIMAYVGVNVLGWGLIGAWIAVFADQFLRYVLALWRFRSGKWVAMKV